MQASNVLPVLVQTAMILAMFYLCTGIGFLGGRLFGKQATSFSYANLSQNFLTGLIFIISVYSVIVTTGRSINVLMLPLPYLVYRNMPKAPLPVQYNFKVIPARFAEVASIAFVSVVLLHLFPESEYKQNDAFFYLKISESLNLTGQENISHYSNVYSSAYHGMEPYHYFELWITSFIIRFTQGFYPSIHVARFVVQGLMLTGVILGLYTMAEQALSKKLSWVQKLFCWSFLFIMPNLLPYAPKLYAVFIGDFEGNMLARPNFKIIYLLLIPAIIQLQKQRKLTQLSMVWLLMLCVTSFQFAIVFVPAMVLYAIWLWFRRKEWLFIPKMTLPFIVLFAAMYFFFGQKHVPSFVGQNTSFLADTLRGYKFIAFATVTSAIYVGIMVLLLLLPLWLTNKKRLADIIKSNIGSLMPLAFLAASGIVLARALYLKDNAYQFIFITHIVATLFVWVMYLRMGENGKRIYWTASIFFIAGWLAQWFVAEARPADVFQQNGQYVYNGRQYSAAYIAQVKKYFETNKPSAGAYIADSSFYNQLYYSRRNPSVYFLPITYIIANGYNRNIEFCISDSAAINQYEDNKVYRNYIDNAIQRSLFYNYGKEHGFSSYPLQVKHFIKDYRLDYIIAAPGFDVSMLRLPVKQKLVDAGTGEQFLVLQNNEVKHASVAQLREHSLGHVINLGFYRSAELNSLKMPAFLWPFRSLFVCC